MSAVRLHRLATVSSTMDVVHDLAHAGAPEGTAVAAGEQSAGRGSRGRTWVSPPGGLWLSVLLRPDVTSGLDLLSLRAGLAVSHALETDMPGVRLRLKWPNDLMLGERKLGGILCEARWQGESLGWIVVGLGLNVGNAAPGGERVAATLRDCAPDLSAEALADPIARAIVGIDALHPRLTPAELTDFDGVDWLRGRRVAGPVEGVADGVEPDGALRVRRDDGVVIPLRIGPVTLAESSVGA